MGNASGHEPLYKNGKPYVVSVFQRKDPGGKVGFIPGQGLAQYWHSAAPVLRPSVG